MLLYLFLTLIANPSYATQSWEERAEAIVSLFENSDPQPQYCYIENIDDGRGYTAGKIGFTSATGDMLAVVNEYLRTSPPNRKEWFGILPILKDRADKQSDDTNGLEELPTLWAASCREQAFTEAQDFVASTENKIPARNIMRNLKLSSHLAYLIFYDSVVQHGDGDSADSVSALIRSTGPRPINESEAAYLQRFLEVRRQDLLNPDDQNSRNAWRESVGRIDSLESLLNAQNMDLAPPFTLEVFGEAWDFTDTGVYKHEPRDLLYGIAEFDKRIAWYRSSKL